MGIFDKHERRKLEIYEQIPDGWVRNNGALNAPEGYCWISNKESIYSPYYRHALLKLKK